MKNNPDFVMERGTALIDKVNTIRLINPINALKTAQERTRHRVAVIGSGSLRDVINVMNITFDYHFMDADRLAYIQKPCRIQFTYAADMEELPEEAIDKLCSSLEGDSNEPVYGKVDLPCESIKNCDALLLFLPKSGSNIDWEREYALFDFAFFVTSAIGALNITERAFLTEIGAGLIGGERMALALANSGFINNTEDYSQLPESVNARLRKIFDGKRLSVLTDIDDELRTYFDSVVAPNLQEYHTNSINRIANRCTQIIFETIADAKEQYNISEDEINNAIYELNLRKDMFVSKGEGLCLMAKSFVEGNVKGKLMNEMADYNEGLKKEAQKNTDKFTTKEEALESVESYFSEAWKHFLREQTPNVHSMFEEEASYIEKRIQEDIGDLISGMGSMIEDSEFTLTGFPGMDAGIYSQAYERKAVKTSTLMLAAVIPLAFMNFPLAITAAAAAVGTRKYEKTMEREQFSSSMARMIDDVSSNFDLYVRNCVEEEFNAGIADLCGTIKDVYTRMFETTLKSLEELKDSLGDLHEKMRFINAFDEETAQKLTQI